MHLNLLAILIATSFVSQAAGARVMTSPSGVVAAELSMDALGQLQFRVRFNTDPVIEDSRLGITVDGIDLGKGVEIGEPEAFETREVYAIRGHHREAVNWYHSWSYPLIHKESQRHYNLEFRLYDDGVAYRYIVPGNGKQHVNGESSTWIVAKEAKTWFFERDSHWKLKSYAGEWISADIDDMETVSNQGPIQGTPLVFEFPNAGGFAVITKAALYNYSGMRLEAKGSRIFQANFTEGDEGFDVEGDIITPWRVLMLADDLNSLVNSDLIANLNPAPDAKLFPDTRYIRPGRSVWSWMTMRLGTIQDQSEFIDMAAKMGFEYTLIDDGWKEWPNPWTTISNLARQGAQKGVGTWIWVHSEDINDPAGDYSQMRAYLDKVKASGACGVKTDFMNSEAKSLIDFEIRLLQLAAERKLMVNFHGCHAATGESRTYPNELTREGIRGIEVNLHKNGHLSPTHNTALPFTRLLLGHGDYTPVYLSNPGPTTFAHQLATPIVFYSPLQIYAEHPEFLMKNPHVARAIGLLKSFPTVWDETSVLKGSAIGRLAAFARRSGDTWFVGILNGVSPANFDLCLSFLSDGSFHAQILEDDLLSDPVEINGLNPLAEGKLDQYTSSVPLKIREAFVSKDDSIQISMPEGGGFVAVFKKLSPTD